MGMEYWWKETEKAESRKYSDKSLIQCHFVYHKSHTLAWDRTRASAVTGWRQTA